MSLCECCCGYEKGLGGFLRRIVEVQECNGLKSFPSLQKLLLEGKEVNIAPKSLD